nr:hypothetical protein POPTR_013G121100 [Ipomoea batatas]
MVHAIRAAAATAILGSMIALSFPDKCYAEWAAIRVDVALLRRSNDDIRPLLCSLQPRLTLPLTVYVQVTEVALVLVVDDGEIEGGARLQRAQNPGSEFGPGAPDVRTCLALVRLLYPYLEPGRNVSVGCSTLCQSGVFEFTPSSLNTKLPSSRRVASTELSFSAALTLVDHTKFCAPSSSTRSPSRILNLEEWIAAEGIGVTLFATHATVIGEIFLYQIPT